MVDEREKNAPEERPLAVEKRRMGVTAYQIWFWVCLLGSIVATIIIRNTHLHPVYWGIPLLLISGGSYILGRGQVEALRKSEEERRKRMRERRKNGMYF